MLLSPADHNHNVKQAFLVPPKRGRSYSKWQENIRKQQTEKKQKWSTGEVDKGIKENSFLVKPCFYHIVWFVLFLSARCDLAYNHVLYFVLLFKSQPARQQRNITLCDTVWLPV